MEERLLSEGEKQNQFILRAGFGLCLLSSILGYFINFFSGIFIIFVLIFTYYCSSYLAIRKRPVTNFLRSFKTPRTKWCSKIEFDHILMPPDVDEALEKLFERIINEYIESWYSQLSQDEEFLQEMRILFKEITCEIIVRLCRVDITETLLNDLIPIIVQHLDSYLWAAKHCSLCEADLLLRQHTADKDSGCLFETWLSFMGKSVHPALADKEAEGDYFENLTERMLPTIIKNRTVKSRLANNLAVAIVSNVVLKPMVDLLCDPKILNKLLLVLFDPEPSRQFDSSQHPPVRLLFKFIHTHSVSKSSALHVDLSAILKDNQLLCAFLQFLKKNGGVNLLQFCLAFEDFNKKMMVVDLKENDLQILHRDASKLFETYIKVGSDNFIRFETEIINNVDAILKQGPKNIQKLRTSPPLFRAYEQVYNNLEDNFCPKFHTSEEYLCLVLGPRISEDTCPDNVSKSYSGQCHSTSKFSKNKDKKGKGSNWYVEPVEGVHEVHRNSSVNEEVEEPDGETEVRDLSAWRISIPRVDARNASGKSNFFFIIQVQRIDVASKCNGEDLEWTVERQYHEFYSLQSALVQYHGIFDDAKLPPRSKLFGGKGLDVLQSKLEPFQDYLVKLLQRPSLKNSDLLHTFLTQKQEFNEATSYPGISRMIKSVPTKLTKEKGQFLRTFISTFVSTTMSPTPKPAKPEDHVDFGKKATALYTSDFSFKYPFSNASLGPSQTCSVKCLYDVLLYLGLKVFNLSEHWLKLFLGMRWLIASSFNYFVNFTLASKFDDLLNSGRVSFLVNLIEESLFEPPEKLLGEAELIRQREETILAMRNYLPNVMRTIIGEKKYLKGTATVINCLQEPILNKQLALTLLEVLLLKILPELRV